MEGVQDVSGRDGARRWPLPAVFSHDTALLASLYLCIALLALPSGVSFLHLMAVEPPLRLWGGIGALLAFAALCRACRTPLRTGDLALDVARLALAGFGLGMLSRLLTLAGAGWPLHDDVLVRADALLGFHWPAYWQWVTHHVVVSDGLRLAYNSIGAQMAVLVLVFVVTRQRRAAQTLFLGFLLGGLATVLIGGLFPAAGARLFYQPWMAGHDPMRRYLALRGGSRAWLLAPSFTGLVWFPSFHAALAVLYVRLSRCVRGLFWPALVLNGLLVASAPIFGGHHLVDLLAGIALMVVILLGIEEASSGPCKSGLEG